MKITNYSDLESAYIDAASELHSKESSLQNVADELHSFIKFRDALREHSEFSGSLPETFYSGSYLDPEGVDVKTNEWAIQCDR